MINPRRLSEEEMMKFKKKQERIKKLRAKCSKDEHGNPLYVATINRPIKISAYTYKSNRIPVGFYCPETGELYDLNCKKVRELYAY